MTSRRRAAPPSHYEVLGVSESADARTIKKAYYELARTLHPDSAGGRAAEGADGADAFRAVQAAYEVLRDAEKRREYDAERIGAVKSIEDKEGPAMKARWAAARRLRNQRTQNADESNGAEQRRQQQQQGQGKDAGEEETLEDLLKRHRAQQAAPQGPAERHAGARAGMVTGARGLLGGNVGLLAMAGVACATGIGFGVWWRAQHLNAQEQQRRHVVEGR